MPPARSTPFSFPRNRRREHALSMLARKRLATLINYMRTLPASADRHFDMSTWFNRNLNSLKRGAPQMIKIPEDGLVKDAVLNICGTSACALGWATTIPAFSRAGLKLVYDDIQHGMRIKASKNYSDYVEVLPRTASPEEKEYAEHFDSVGAEVTLEGSGATGMSAAQEFFDIGEGLAGELFSGMGPCGEASTPREWAKRAAEVCRAHDGW